MVVLQIFEAQAWEIICQLQEVNQHVRFSLALTHHFILVGAGNLGAILTLEPRQWG